MKIKIYVTSCTVVEVPNVKSLKFSRDRNEITLLDDAGDELAFFKNITGYTVEYV